MWVAMEWSSQSQYWSVHSPWQSVAKIPAEHNKTKSEKNKKEHTVKKRRMTRSLKRRSWVIFLDFRSFPFLFGRCDRQGNKKDEKTEQKGPGQVGKKTEKGDERRNARTVRTRKAKGKRHEESLEPLPQ